MKNHTKVLFLLLCCLYDVRTRCARESVPLYTVESWLQLISKRSLNTRTTIGQIITFKCIFLIFIHIFLFTLKVESSVSPYTQLDIFGWAKIRRKNAENSNCYTLFSSPFDTFDVGMFRCYIRMSFAVFYDLWPMWIAFYSIVIQIIDTLNMINHFFLVCKQNFNCFSRLTTIYFYTRNDQ